MESTGKIGENIAARYLKAKHYHILNRNFFLRAQSGPKIAEIDLIAKKDNLLVFVEVKTIAANSNYLAQDKVDRTKLFKIAKAAEFYLMKNKIPYNTKWQIDVIAINLLPDTRPAFLKYFFAPAHNLSHFKNVSLS